MLAIGCRFCCNLAMDVFGLVVVLRPGQQFFSQACRDGATASWVVNQYFGELKVSC